MCVCVYVRVPVLVLGLLSDTLFLLLFFFAPFFRPLLALLVSLSHSLALSLPTYDSEVRKKLSVFYAHTLLQANKPY